jgi:predicted nucleic acid-binding protein
LGLVLDSSAAVAAERQGKNAKQLLEAIAFETGDEDLVVSVVTLLELAHGLTRADTAERRDKRQRFLQELMSVVPVHPITAPVALRAGRIDGQSQAKGIRIPLSDLLIGVTALELGYRIGTHNLRHFQLIPDLSILPL